MKKAVKVTGIVLFWVGAFLVLTYSFFLHDSKSAYDHEIALTMAAGIPLTPRELAEDRIVPVDATNAADEILGLTKAFKKLPESAVKAAFDLEKPLADPKSKIDLNAAAATIDRMEPVLTLARDATRRTDLYFGSEGTFKHTLLFPEMSKMKSAAKLLVLKFRLESRLGRESEAIEYANDAFHLAGMLYLDHEMISYLIALAIQKIAVQAVADEAHRDPTSARLVDILVEFADQVPKVDMRAIQLGETSRMLDTFRIGETENPMEEIFGFSFGAPEISFEDRIRSLEPLQWYAKAHFLRGTRLSWRFADRSPPEYARSLAALPPPNWMTRISLRVLKVDEMETVTPLDLRPLFESARVWSRILARALREKRNGRFPIQMEEPLTSDIPEYLKAWYWSDGETIRVKIENEINPEQTKTNWFPIRPKDTAQ